MKPDNISNTILTSVMFLLLLTGCSKLIETGKSSRDLSSEDVFASDQSATAVMINTYRDMMDAIDYANGNTTRHSGLYSDELQRPGAAPTDVDAPWFNSNVLPSDKTLQKFWSKPYDYIFQCNNILENIVNNNRLSDTLKARLEGEARFLRAFHYFHLVNFFGAVPAITVTDYRVNLGKGREPVQEIWKLIIDDLTVAENLLPDNINTTDKSLQVGIRASKWAAKALLARVYLYQKNWEQAEQYASKVLSSRAYQLETSLNNVFLINSKEVIFQLQPIKNQNNSAEATFFIPAGSGAPQLVIREGLYNSFETVDQRRKSWLGTYVTGAKNYYYPNKYKTRSSTPAKEYNVVLRYAELWLIRAEARAQLGKLYGAGSASSDVNTIRQRAGCASLPEGLTQQQMLQRIEQERRVELFAEWGHRWFDLKRTAAFNNPGETRAEEVMRTLKPGFTMHQLLLPVPDIERTRNINLDQNPGYN
ncbi:MAG: RagB/SusD family nutrient uptake outer membrane protein [Pseudobacter sp.]|uniref:RagB/SusD family nutrient uptake outer membrane protein n=1 Tax=Pseudobacter sp. TaxID=2045420 RepID=UPI003F815E1E